MAFPTTGILDSGVGADESPIATKWSGPIYPALDQLRRVSNQIAAPASSFGGSWYDLSSFGPDCEAYITIATFGADGNDMFLYARQQNSGTTSLDYYAVQFEPRPPPHFFRLIVGTDGSDSVIDSDDTLTWAVGDKIGIACIGSDIQGWRCPISTGVWVQVLGATDTTYPGAGDLALACDTSFFRFTDFGGGTIGAAAAAPLRSTSFLSAIGW